LSWSAPPAVDALFLAYDILSADDAANFLDAPGVTCLESDDASDVSATDSTVLAPGERRYYLVRAENVCDSGSIGATSLAVGRFGRTCP